MLLRENARQQQEIVKLRQQLTVYHEFCVCLDDG